MALNQSDETDVISLSLKQLNLYDALKFQRKPSKAGRKLTLVTTRTAVWDFWHSNSIYSTLTVRSVKLKVTEKSYI